MPRRWAAPASTLLAGALVAGFLQLGSGAITASATQPSAPASPACVNPSPGSQGIPLAPTITGITPSETGLSIDFTFPQNSASPQYIRVLLNGASSVASGTTSPITVTGLTPATDYSVVICGGAPGGDGDPSSAVSTRTLGDAPAPARRATAPEAPSLEVATTATSVTVTPRSAGDGGSALTAVNVTIDGTSFRGNPGQSFTKDALSPGRDVSVSASVENAVGSSPPSTAIARTLGRAPGAPARVEARTSPASWQLLDIRWEAAPANGAPVTRYVATVNGVRACDVPADAWTCTISRPSARTAAIDVVAYAGDLKGPAATTTITLPPTRPGYVAEADAILIDCRTQFRECTWLSRPSSSKYIVVTWKAPLDDGGLPVTSVTARFGDRSCSAGATGSCRMGGFLPGLDVPMSGSVVARNAVGPGPEAGMGVREPWRDPVATPRTPVGLRLAADNGAIALDWALPTLADGPIPEGYFAQATCAADCPTPPPAPVSLPCDPLSPQFCRLTGLQLGLQYRVTLVSRFGERASAPAEGVVAVPGPPGTPAAPTVAWQGASLIANWATPGGAGLTYRLEDDRGGIACPTQAATQCTITPPTIATTYRVVATNAQGSTPSGFSRPVQRAALPALSGISVSRLAIDRSRITWAVPTFPPGSQAVRAVVRGQYNEGCGQWDTTYTRCLQDRLGPVFTICDVPVTDGGCTATFSQREYDMPATVTLEGPPAEAGPATTFALQHLFLPDTPRNPRITGYGRDSLTVAWDAPLDGARIATYIAKTNQNGRSCTVPVGTLTCTITGLPAGTNMDILVGSAVSGGRENFSAQFASGRAGPPAPPLNVVIRPWGWSQADVLWTPAPGTEGGSAPTTSYTVTMSTGEQCTRRANEDLRCVFLALKRGAAVTATVTATNQAGTSLASTPSAPAIVGIQDPISKPTLRQSGTDIVVEWSTRREGSENVMVSRFDVTANGREVCRVGANSPMTCTFSGFAPGTTVNVVVTSQSDVARRPSPEASITVLGRPKAPTGVAVTPTDKGALIEWEAPIDTPVTAPSRYVVTTMEGLFSPVFTQVCDVPASVTSCEVKGLENGTPIGIGVSAVNAAGRTAASAEIVTPGAITDAATGRPGMPTNLTAEYDAQTDTVLLRWNRPAQTGGARQLEYQTIMFSLSLNWAGGCATRATSCTVKLPTKREYGMTLTFDVTAKNAKGWSIGSEGQRTITTRISVPKPTS